MEKLNSLKQSYKDALIAQRKTMSESMSSILYSLSIIVLWMTFIWSLEELDLISNALQMTIAAWIGWVLICIGVYIYNYYKTNLLEMFYKLVKSIHASCPQAPETPESEPSEE